MTQFCLRRLTAFLLLFLLWCSFLPPSSTATIQAQAKPPARTVSAIEAIRQRGNTVLVGVQYDYEPFGFVNTKGEVSGFDVDLMRAVAERWDAQVQFIPVTASDAVQKLAAGAVDLLAASLTHTSENEGLIDFSQSYFVDQSALVVKSNAKLRTLADLQGMTIAAVRGSSAFTQISRVAQENGLAVTILPFQEYLPALAAVKAGQVQALAAGLSYLTRAAEADPQLVVLEETFAQEIYALGLPQGDSLLRGLVDYTLQELKRNQLYDRIYQKWFPTGTPHPIELFSGQWPFTLVNSPTALTAPLKPRFAEIKQRGKLIVGIKYDFPPFGFLDTQGAPAGFEVDLARELGRLWLGDKSAVELVPVTDATRIPLLVSGAVDLVMAALPHTHAYDEIIDFSTTYFADEQSLLVKSESPYQGLSDLKSKSIATINGSSADEVIKTRNRADQLQLNLLPFQEYSSAFQALKAGQVDAFVAGRIVLDQFARENSDVRVLTEPLAPERYAIGLANFDGELRDQVNLALQILKLEGVYDLLYQQWFGNATPDPIELWVSPAPSALVPPGSRTPVAVAILPTATPTQPEPPTPAPTGTSTPTTVATATTVAAAAAPARATASATSTPTRRPTATATRPRAATLTAATPTATATPTPRPGPTVVATTTVILIPTTTPEVVVSPTATVTSTATPAKILATYQVQAGDTLATIAQQFYANQGLWPLIYEANKAVIGDNPNILVVGLELAIPALPR